MTARRATFLHMLLPPICVPVRVGEHKRPVRAGRTGRAGGEGGTPAVTGAPRDPMLEADWQAGDALVDKLSAAYISETAAAAKDDAGRPPSSADSWASTDTGPRSPSGMPLPPQHCLGGAGASPASPQARRGLGLESTATLGYLTSPIVCGPASGLGSMRHAVWCA